MALPSGFRINVQRLAVDSLTFFRGAILELDKRVTGETLQSLEYQILFDNNRTRVIFYGVDTIEFRLYGRNPGKYPPIGPLQVWLDEKRLDINPYALQASLGLYGTQRSPVPYIETVERDMLPFITEFFESEQVTIALLSKLDNLFSGRK